MLKHIPQYGGIAFFSWIACEGQGQQRALLCFRSLKSQQEGSSLGMMKWAHPPPQICWHLDCRICSKEFDWRFQPKTLKRIKPKFKTCPPKLERWVDLTRAIYATKWNKRSKCEEKNSPFEDTSSYTYKVCKDSPSQFPMTWHLCPILFLCLYHIFTIHHS